MATWRRAPINAVRNEKDFGSPMLVDRRMARACNGAIMGAPKGHPKDGGGRAKGTRNRVMQEFRETVAQLLDDNRENIGKWLAQVADGTTQILENSQVVWQDRSDRGWQSLIYAEHKKCIPADRGVNLQIPSGMLWRA